MGSEMCIRDRCKHRLFVYYIISKSYSISNILLYILTATSCYTVYSISVRSDISSQCHHCRAQLLAELCCLKCCLKVRYSVLRSTSRKKLLLYCTTTYENVLLLATYQAIRDRPHNAVCRTYVPITVCACPCSNNTPYYTEHWLDWLRSARTFL